MKRKRPHSSNLSAAQSIRQVVWVVSRVVARNPWLSVALLISVISQSAFPAGIALVSRGMVTEITNGTTSPLDLLPWIISSAVLTAVYGVLGRSLGAYCNTTLQDRTNIRTIRGVMEHAAELEVSFFENAEFQDAMTRIKRNAGSSMCGVQRCSIALVTKCIQLLSLLAILVYIEKMIIVFVVVLGIPYLMFKSSLARNRFSVLLNQATRRRWSSYFTGLLTKDRSVPEVRVMGLAPLLIDKFKNIMAGFLVENDRYRRKTFIGESVYFVASTILLYGLFCFVLTKIATGGLLISDALVFGAVILVLRNNLNETASHYSSIYEHLLHVADYRRFLRIQPERDWRAGQRPDSVAGEIRIENLSFKYPGTDRFVLHDLSLRIRPGESLALVGVNAAGKTTLAKLIAGLYMPTEGNIYIDDIPIPDWSLAYLQKQISFVFQDYIRYEGSAEENIAYGDWERLLKDRSGIEDVARKASITDLVESLPNGYETSLGRYFGEHNLSGGQWQHFALARSLAKQNPAILIFDEFTSSLDSKKEYQAFQALQKISSGKTTIIISHRFSTIKMASRIVVLDGGRIVEEGTHETLVSGLGVYADLYSQHREQYRLEQSD